MCAQMHVSTYVHVCAYPCVCVCLCMHACACVCVSVRTCVCECGHACGREKSGRVFKVLFGILEVNILDAY